MISNLRIILYGFFAFMLITQYQNCSSSSENTMFESSTLPAASEGLSDPGKVSIQVSTLVSPLSAEPTENHISVSGSCNPGGRKYNYIQYSVIEPISKRKLNLSVGKDSVYDLRDAICENGRFYIVVPIANPDQEGPNPTISTYLLNVEFYVSNVEGKFEPKVTNSMSIQIN